jgi:nitrite reductase/ring-hydroxylating ferredoxin subunit
MMPSSAYTNEQLREMVQADRVHRSIYVEPQVFEIEMQKIFGRVWLYVGHESLVPNPGDYYCTTLARQSVVLSRHSDGQVYVLYNRCGHRGAKVLSQVRGNAKVFTCMYHGWGFRPNGELAGVPMRADFPEAPLREPQSGMVRLPRVESYRGFVFASFNPDVMPLADYLDEGRRGIDELTDRSPGRQGGVPGRLPPLPLPRQLEAADGKYGRHVPPRRLPWLHRRARWPAVPAPRRQGGRRGPVLRPQRGSHCRPDRGARHEARP